MTRIPKHEIERLKVEVSLERLVQGHGVTLTRHGKDLHGLCPFHEDKGPSLVISPDKNLWHCLGACNTGGSVIDWIIKAHGVSFRHACEILTADQIPAAPARHVKIATVPKLPAPVDFNADDRALLHQVTTYYHEALKKNPEALAYLTARGLSSMALIERYRIGFANRTLGLRIPDKNRKAGLEIRSRLAKLGVLRESGHEHFNGSIVIPILDERGNVRGMYGRKVRQDLREGTPLHLYLPGPHRGVFNVEALARYQELILCESLIDALTLIQAGFPNVTTSYGVSGFTPDHWSALREHRTQRVLIAYDRDDAGDRAAESLAAELVAAGLECFRVQFPRGMDANEYALKVQPAAKSLGLVIRKALWMGKGPAPQREDVAVVLELAPPAATTPPGADPATAPVPAAGLPINPEAPIRPAPATTEAPAMTDQAAKAEPQTTPAPLLVPPADAAAEPPPASPQPLAASLPPIERHGQDVRVTLGDRQYRIRGLEKNVGVAQLKVNLLVARDDRFYVDTLDLYLARPRMAYCREAGLELGLVDDVLRKDLGRILLALEELQDEQRKAALAPKKPEVKLTPEERDEALELLRDPRLLERILEDFRRAGVVGEETNKLVGYLAGVSRNLEAPLAVVIQSSSAAGKSSLMESILAFIPPEERVQYSAMTGQSLFYMGETDLKHKVLAIAEEEGAERASYALKLLQSEGELTIASTGKDPASGRHVTHEYHVEGPVMIFLTTTAVDIDEELLNRCIVLTVNEDREQTRIIHKQQRERQTLEGLINRRDVSKILKRHQNAQRLLRPLLVANPYAPDLTFRDDQTRTRRDHGKYLTLIRTIALLHQHQRPTRGLSHAGQELEYIEVTRDDIRTANRLAHEVLGRTLDELSPQTRRVLDRLDGWVRTECERLKMVREDFRFERRDVRVLGWAHTQARAHLEKLVELEYVMTHRGTRGQSFVYELVYDGQGQDGRPFLMGLIDPDTLPAECGYDGKLAGSGAKLAAETDGLAEGWRPQIGPMAARWRDDSTGPQPAPRPGFGNGSSTPLENTVLETAASILTKAHVLPVDGPAPRRSR